MNKPLYLLKGTIIRNQSDINDLIEVNDVFQDDDLLKARIAAFNKYQSYIDVFLDSINKKYDSFEQATTELECFINTYTDSYILNNPELGKLDSDFDKGLFIYLVTDSLDTFITKEGTLIYNQKVLVHAFDKEINNYWREICHGLIEEYKFFTKNIFIDEILLPSNIVNKLSITDFRTEQILSSPIDIQNHINKNKPTLDDLLNLLEEQ